MKSQKSSKRKDFREFINRTCLSRFIQNMTYVRHITLFKGQPYSTNYGGCGDTLSNNIVSRDDMYRYSGIIVPNIYKPLELEGLEIFISKFLGIKVHIVKTKLSDFDFLDSRYDFLRKEVNFLLSNIYLSGVNLKIKQLENIMYNKELDSYLKDNLSLYHIRTDASPSDIGKTGIFKNKTNKILMYAFRCAFEDPNGMNNHIYSEINRIFPSDISNNYFFKSIVSQTIKKELFQTSNHFTQSLLVNIGSNTLDRVANIDRILKCKRASSSTSTYLYFGYYTSIDKSTRLRRLVTSTNKLNDTKVNKITYFLENLKELMESWRLM